MTKPSVTCGQCRMLLNEDRELEPGQRNPCPNCGSTTRLFSAADTASFAAESLTSVPAGVMPPIEWRPNIEIPPEIEDRYEGRWIAWDLDSQQVVGDGETLDEAIQASDAAWKPDTNCISTTFCRATP